MTYEMINVDIMPFISKHDSILVFISCWKELLAYKCITKFLIHFLIVLDIKMN